MLLQYWPPQLPPINVMVQPPVGGMPEWEKTLISAGVGALFGILSSFVMEYVKPAIVHHKQKKVIRKQLAAELTDNLSDIEAFERMCRNAVEGKEKARSDLAFGMVWAAMTALRRDRYDFYFGDDKAIVYELDKHHSLVAFYAGIDTLRTVAEKKHIGLLHEILKPCAFAGHECLKDLGV